jgi:hypothetical protein
MDRLHLLRKSANERVDRVVGKTCYAHAQYAQACELWYEPAHELPWTGSQIESAQVRARTRKNCTTELKRARPSYERKTESFKCGTRNM